MLLKDILAKELVDWPHGVEILTQSLMDEEIYNYNGGAFDGLVPQFYASVMHSEGDVYPTVTKEEWEEARRELLEPKQVKINLDVDLPEVGSRVRIRETNVEGGRGHSYFQSHKGEEAEIIAHHSPTGKYPVAVYYVKDDEGGKYHGLVAGWFEEIVPEKTERELWIEAAMQAYFESWQGEPNEKAFGAIYDKLIAE